MGEHAYSAKIEQIIPYSDSDWLLFFIISNFVLILHSLELGWFILVQFTNGGYKIVLRGEGAFYYIGGGPKNHREFEGGVWNIPLGKGVSGKVLKYRWKMLIFLGYLMT